MENNRNFENYVTLHKTILIISNFGIQLCLGCSLDVDQNICYYISGLDLIGMLLFYCLKTMEQQNENENKKIVKHFLIDKIPL